MNTQSRVHSLQAGEALPVPGHGAGRAVLSEGEVLVHAPARWLAGTIVFPPPQRLSAPALLRLEPGGSVIALHAATVAVEEAPSLVAALKAALAAWRLPHWLSAKPRGADAR